MNGQKKYPKNVALAHVIDYVPRKIVIPAAPIKDKNLKHNKTSPKNDAKEQLKLLKKYINFQNITMVEESYQNTTSETAQPTIRSFAGGSGRPRVLQNSST